MSVLRLDIEGNPNRIPYRSFIQVANNSLGILNDLDFAYTRKHGATLDWFVNDLSKNGGLRIEVYSQVRPMKRVKYEDFSSAVVNSFVEGFNVLENQGKSPALLTETGMHKAQVLTNLIGENGMHAVVASVPNTDKKTEITRRSAVNIDLLIPEASHALGSVEGTLEVISIHRGNRFVIYQHGTSKAVSCFYAKLPLLDRIKGALGQRVMASGELFRNAKGEPVKLKLGQESQLKIFGSESLPVYELLSLAGSDPDFTGDWSTEEFIRHIRE
jgi:hypothetical protein